MGYTLSSDVTVEQIVNAVNAGMIPCLKYTDDSGYVNYICLISAVIGNESYHFQFSGIEVTFTSLSDTFSYTYEKPTM